MRAHEQDFRRRIECQELCGGFDSVDRPGFHVEENHVGAECVGAAHRFQRVGGLPDNLPSGVVHQHRTDHATPAQVIVDNNTVSQ